MFKLFSEKLTGEKLDVPEVTQSEEGQKQKLAIVLGTTNRVSRLYTIACIILLMPFLTLVFSAWIILVEHNTKSYS